MKGIVVTPDMEISVQDFGCPLHKSLGAVVGGCIERILPNGLDDPYCLICNEGGRMKGLPVNPIASWLYGTQKHRHPIVGTIVLMKDEKVANRVINIVGLTDDDVDKLAVMLSKLKCLLTWGRA